MPEKKSTLQVFFRQKTGGGLQITMTSSAVSAGSKCLPFSTLLATRCFNSKLHTDKAAGTLPPQCNWLSATLHNRCVQDTEKGCGGLVRRLRSGNEEIVKGRSSGGPHWSPTSSTGPTSGNQKRNTSFALDCQKEYDEPTPRIIEP